MSLFSSHEPVFGLDIGHETVKVAVVAAGNTAATITSLAEIPIPKGAKTQKGIKEKAMFGGISFLLNGRMFCGVLKDDLVVRVNPKEHEILAKKPGTRPMDFTGKPMKGFLYVNMKGYEKDKDLQEWIKQSFDFVSTLPEKKEDFKDLTAFLQGTLFGLKDNH